MSTQHPSPLSSPPARQRYLYNFAIGFSSYIALCGLKLLLMMNSGGQQSAPAPLRVKWTEDETHKLLQFLQAHKSEMTDGCSFRGDVFNAAAKNCGSDKDGGKAQNKYNSLKTMYYLIARYAFRSGSKGWSQQHGAGIEHDEDGEIFDAYVNATPGAREAGLHKYRNKGWPFWTDMLNLVGNPTVSDVFVFRPSRTTYPTMQHDFTDDPNELYEANTSGIANQNLIPMQGAAVTGPGGYPMDPLSLLTAEQLDAIARDLTSTCFNIQSAAVNDSVSRLQTLTATVPPSDPSIFPGYHEHIPAYPAHSPPSNHFMPTCSFTNVPSVPASVISPHVPSSHPFYGNPAGLSTASPTTPSVAPPFSVCSTSDSGKRSFADMSSSAGPLPQSSECPKESLPKMSTKVGSRASSRGSAQGSARGASRGKGTSRVSSAATKPLVASVSSPSSAVDSHVSKKSRTGEGTNAAVAMSSMAGAVHHMGDVLKQLFTNPAPVVPASGNMPTAAPPDPGPTSSVQPPLDHTAITMQYINDPSIPSNIKDYLYIQAVRSPRFCTIFATMPNQAGRRKLAMDLYNTRNEERSARSDIGSLFEMVSVPPGDDGSAVSSRFSADDFRAAYDDSSFY